MLMDALRYSQNDLNAATAKERERCAKIARSLISTDKDWDNGLWNQACERIALKIETS